MPRIIIACIFSTLILALATYQGLSAYSARAADSGARVIKITAHKFDYAPNEIRLKKDEPVILEFTSTDVDHGFNIPDFGLRADALPGETTRLSFTPQKAGTFEFHCDNFCGLDHESMSGVILVE